MPNTLLVMDCILLVINLVYSYCNHDGLRINLYCMYGTVYMSNNSAAASK